MIYINDPESFSTIFRWNKGRCVEAFFKPFKFPMVPSDIDMKLHEKHKLAFKQPVSPLQ